MKPVCSPELKRPRLVTTGAGLPEGGVIAPATAK
jgi:hypothetical protein